MEINQIIIMVVLTFIVGAMLLFYLKRRNRKTIYWEGKGRKIRNTYYLNKENKKNGLEKFYFRSGKLNKERKWVNGKIEGKETIFYETGKIYIEKKYTNNLLHGEYIVFSPNGKILEKSVYQEGNLITTEEFPIKSQSEKVNFNSTKLMSTKELSLFSSTKKEYNIIKREEDTKDENKKVKGIWSGLKKMGKVASGYQAVQDRKSAKRITEICDKLYDEALSVTERFRKKLDHRVSDFGKRRLISLQNTTGKFLALLKDIGQKNNVKEYAVSSGVGFTIDSLEKMERIDMEVSKVLTSTAIVGGLTAAAMGGTPVLVTSAVGALATASTGTAISTLSGAAATNATLAWLGGGAISAGGGGMAAGAAVLGTIQVAATGGVALLAAGLLASTHYSKKLTQVKEKQKAVETEVEKMQLMWELLEGINKRTEELDVVTAQLEKRITEQLSFLIPLSVDFDSKDQYYGKVFQKNGALIISMNELAQTPLLNTEGNLSSESAKIVENTHKILNTDL